MKHTKSMIIKPTHESEDLTLYTINTGYIHKTFATPIIKNLQRKVKAGTYNKELAIDAFYKLAEIGAKYYYKEFSDVEDAPKYFDVTARYTAAAGILEHYEEHILEAQEEKA